MKNYLAENEDEFEDIFLDYLLQTDGKLSVAKAVLTVAKQVKAKTFLELGDDKKRLTCLLPEVFQSDFVKEKHSRCCTMLSALPGSGRMKGASRQTRLLEGGDLILLSYSNAALRGKSVEPFIARLKSLLSKPDGRLFFLEYCESCHLSQFVSLVKFDCECAYNNGTLLCQQELNELTIESRNILRIPGHIWGRGLNDLYNTLSWFFDGKNLQHYLDNRLKYLPKLAELAIELGDGKYILGVRENLVEIA